MKKKILIILTFLLIGVNVSFADNITYNNPTINDLYPGLGSEGIYVSTWLFPEDGNALAFCNTLGGIVYNVFVEDTGILQDLYNYNGIDWVITNATNKYTSITCDIPVIPPQEEENNSFLGLIDTLVGGVFTGVDTLLTGNLGSIIIVVLVFAVIGLIIYGIRKFIKNK